MSIAVKLNNGYTFPLLGLGTWKSEPGQVTQAVKDAIDAGYRHIDCAHVYGNEHEVGEGINAKIAEGVIKREDIFVTSKLWNTFHAPKDVRPAIERTLKNLNLSYLDLYLIHWPMGYQESGTELFPRNEAGDILYSDVDYLDTYKALETLVDAGLTKSIGLSNFNARQVDRICSNARIQPVVNQVECHPYLNQARLSAHCKSKNIVITAYSPLGSPDRPWAQPGEPLLMEDPKLHAIAKKYNKTVAQILIRYQIQKGHAVIPKSVNKDRIISNFQVFDFELSDADIKEIDTFDCNGRFCPLSGATSHPYHPFANDEF
jgi:aldehyde reductase